MILTVNEIQQILPHRYPFLFVDKVIELKVREKVVGIKNVTINEPFFQGHFPGIPILPGVIIIEACGQLAGLGLVQEGASTISQQSRNLKGEGYKIEYLAGVQKFTFKKIVRPGDQLIMTAYNYRKISQLVQVEVKAHIADQLAAEGVLILTSSN